MRSLVYRDVLNEKDIIVQIARCSFDLHVQDIYGYINKWRLSSIMLHPGGIMNFDYLIECFPKIRILVAITTVPTIIHTFIQLSTRS